MHLVPQGLLQRFLQPSLYCRQVTQNTCPPLLSPLQMYPQGNVVAVQGIMKDITCLIQVLYHLYVVGYIKGVGVGKIDFFFKEFTPRSWMYELRGQGGKKKKYKIKTKTHLTLSYETYLQNQHAPP